MVPTREDCFVPVESSHVLRIPPTPVQRTIPGHALVEPGGSFSIVRIKDLEVHIRPALHNREQAQLRRPHQLHTCLTHTLHRRLQEQ